MADHNNSGKDPLFLNKVAGGVLAAILFVMVLRDLGGVIYHPAGIAEPAYAIEIPESGLSAGGEEEVIDIAQLIASADIAKGKRISKKCLSCHSFEKGKKSGAGPELYGIFGQPKAGVANFGSYSAAMKAAGGIWDIDSLFGFLEKPNKYMKGTGMSFAGLRKPQDRADIIAYMNSMSDAPKELAPAAPAQIDPMPQDIPGQ